MNELYLHGGPGLPDYMPQFFPQLDNTVFVPQKNPASSMQELIEPLKQATKSLDNFALIAHSFGGVMALEYLKNPAAPKPKALVLIGTPIYFGCEEDFMEECAKRNWKAPTQEDVFLSPLEKENPECRESLRQIFTGFNPQTLSSLRTYLTTFDFRRFLNQIEIPTLVLYGIEDARVPARVQKNYGLGNERVQHAGIDGAGHFAFIEKKNAAAIQEKIKNFLASV